MNKPQKSCLCTVADTGGLQWFQLKPAPLKERVPLIRDDWYREEQKSCKRIEIL